MLLLVNSVNDFVTWCLHFNILPAPVLAGGGGGVYLAIFHLPVCCSNCSFFYLFNFLRWFFHFRIWFRLRNHIPHNFLLRRLNWWRWWRWRKFFSSTGGGISLISVKSTDTLVSSFVVHP